MSVRLCHVRCTILALSYLALVGCQQQDRDELGIRWKKRSYQNWLLRQRPLLASIPKSTIVDYDFTTLVSGRNVSPVVNYHLMAGKWQGIVDLWFTMRLDTNGSPIGFSEETVTFIRLPAKESVIDASGKSRNQYYGIKFTRPLEVAELIKRVAAGQDFADYQKKTDESGDLVCSFFDYNDPWKSHGTREH